MQGYGSFKTAWCPEFSGRCLRSHDQSKLSFTTFDAYIYKYAWIQDDRNLHLCTVESNRSHCAVPGTPPMTCDHKIENCVLDNELCGLL